MQYVQSIAAQDGSKALKSLLTELPRNKQKNTIIFNVTEHVRMQQGLP